MKNLFFQNIWCLVVCDLLAVFLSITASLSAQERISIKDPDITFYYNLPEGWANQNDEYYHYVFLPDSGGKKGMFPQLSITYLENNCPNLEDCFLGEVNGGIQAAFPAAKMGETGHMEINSTKARWVKFTDVETSGKTQTIFNYTMYVFIQNDQYFVLSSKSPAGIDKEAEFTAILKSFHSEKNR